MYGVDVDIAHHKLCLNRKPLDLWTVALIHRQFLDHEESTKCIWSHRPYGLDRARANGEDLHQSAHSIHPSLHNVFVINFVYLKCSFAESLTKTDSGQSARHRS